MKYQIFIWYTEKRLQFVLFDKDVFSVIKKKNY